MAELTLLPGLVESIEKKERLNTPTTVQVDDLRMEGNRWKLTIKDASSSVKAYFSPELSEWKEEGGLENGGILRVEEFVMHTPADQPHVLAIYKAEILSKTAPPQVEVKPEPLAVKMEGGAENIVDENTREQPTKVDTPGAHIDKHSGQKENVAPYKTPAAKIKAQYSGTPGFTPPSTGKRSAQPIQALNPYNNQWTIKARINSKMPKKDMFRNGQTFSVFSMCLVDEQGTEIEATLWRDVADYWFDRLEEGKVYLFSKGKVKPANKSYSSTRNDYAIDFGQETSIEECAEEDPSKMQVKICYVRFDQLPNYVGKKMVVDILAVVKEVQPLGSVKRKSDGSDVPRRELILADKSGKSVRLTLWGNQAETTGAELEGMTDAVLSVTAVRVGDFEGVSLSALQRSNLEVNPETPEAKDLQSWWQHEGSKLDFVRAGEGLASARKAGEGRSNERTLLSDIVKDTADLPSPDAKPEFFNVRVTVMQVDGEQKPFFYPADVATGKKVIEDGNGWRIAADDKACTAMEYRYFVRINVIDMSGSADVMISNDQAERLFGKKADEMHALRESNQQQFNDAIQQPKFTEWNMVLKSNTSSYREELKQRLQGYGRFTASDFVQESKVLLAKIESLKQQG